METLLLGDSASVLASIGGESVDLVVTSPPYDNLRTYNGYTFDFEAIAQELARVLKPGGVIVWVVNDATVKGSETGSSFRQVLYFISLGLNLHDTMIYEKSNYIPLTHNRYEQAFEYMFVLSKGKPKTFNPIKVPCLHAGRKNGSHTFYQASDDQHTKGANSPKHIADYKTKGNIWHYLVGNVSGDGKWKHPAKFPLQLALDHIQSWSNQGDIVLDPFLGSGTTGVAALQLGRKFIGIEISEEYLQIAKNRIEQFKESTCSQSQPNSTTTQNTHS